MKTSCLFLLLAMAGCSRPAPTTDTTSTNNLIGGNVFVTTQSPFPSLSRACEAHGVKCHVNHYRDGYWQAVADDNPESLKSNQWMCSDKEQDAAVNCLIGKLSGGKEPDWPMIDQRIEVGQ